LGKEEEDKTIQTTSGGLKGRGGDYELFHTFKETGKKARIDGSDAVERVYAGHFALIQGETGKRRKVE